MLRTYLIFQHFYIFFSATNVLSAVGGVARSRQISKARSPATKPAIIFNFVSKVVTTLSLLAFLGDWEDMATDFNIKINK
jgi:hypothetical protein